MSTMVKNKGQGAKPLDGTEHRERSRNFHHYCRLFIIYKKIKNMGKKITWWESFETHVKYSANLTDEQAELFEKNQDKFFDKVFYELDRDVEWDKIKNEDSYGHQVEIDEE
jgi:hypothetical protein